jgi:hypothetical protein
MYARKQRLSCYLSAKLFEEPDGPHWRPESLKTLAELKRVVKHISLLAASIILTSTTNNIPNFVSAYPAFSASFFMHLPSPYIEISSLIPSLFSFR